ncbi:Alginate lyase [compost metagenome]
MIQLNLLNLTTPEPKFPGSDDCITYAPGNFPQNEYFYVESNGDIRIWAPTKGASSKSTSRTRTELREVTANGATYNWKFADFTDHWLRAAMTVVQVPKGGETVIGQIHVKDSTRPPVKLSFDKAQDGIGQLTVGFRKAFDQKTPVDYVLLNNIPVGARFTYVIHVTKSGKVIFNASYTDQTGLRRDGKLDLALEPSWSVRELYFKAGVYNQEDPTDTTTPTEGSRAIFHRLEISHDI